MCSDGASKPNKVRKIGPNIAQHETHRSHDYGARSAAEPFRDTELGV